MLQQLKLSKYNLVQCILFELFKIKSWFLKWCQQVNKLFQKNNVRFRQFFVLHLYWMIFMHPHSSHHLVFQKHKTINNIASFISLHLLLSASSTILIEDLIFKRWYQTLTNVNESIESSYWSHQSIDRTIFYL